MKFIKHWAIFAMVLGVSLGAQAETASVKYTGTAIGKSVNVQIPLGTQNFFLGSYNVQESGVGSFLAYCVDPTQWVSTSYKAQDKFSLGLGHFLTDATVRYNNVTSLFSHAYADSLTNATKAAGFQLALWEVFNDDLNLNTGVVKKTDSTNVTVLSEAQSLLGNLANNSWSGASIDYQFTVYSSASYQDFITVTAVPEPESFALILAGLGLVGFSVRRKMEVKK